MGRKVRLETCVDVSNYLHVYDTRHIETYVAPDSPARDTTVASERPELARGGSQHGQGCADTDNNEDGGQAQCTCDRAGCLLEDFHEGVARRRFKGRINTAHAEESGDQHGESQSAVDGNTEENGTGNDDRGMVYFFGHL